MRNSPHLVEPIAAVPPDDAYRKMVAARIFALIALALVAVVQVWVVSAGRMTHWHTYTSNYALLADAFLHRQTSLLVQPRPELLALSDPYDPSLNSDLRLHDLSLFHGKYYLYWGPVPAILEAPFVRLLHRPIGDEKLVLAFILGIVLISGCIMLELRRHLFPGTPPWTMALGVLVAGLAAPMPFLLARAAVYEAAIVAGQFFLLAGIYCSLKAFTGRRTGPVWLVLAGISWALTAGSRPSLVIAIGALVLLFGFRLRQTPGEAVGRSIWPHSSRLAALCIPLVVGAVSLGYYNHVRFGKWYEFGQPYQLAAFNLQKIQDHLFAWANVPPAIYAYFLKPPDVSFRFPFIKAIGGAWTYPDFITLPSDYEAIERIVGIIWCLPFVAFAAVPLLIWSRIVLRGHTMRANDPAGSAPTGHETASEPSEAGWTAGSLLAAAVFGIFPVIFLIGSAMRYLADFTPSLVILAMMGLWQAISQWPGASRRLLIAAALLAMYSIVVGILIGFSGYPGYFYLHR